MWVRSSQDSMRSVGKADQYLDSDQLDSTGGARDGERMPERKEEARRMCHYGQETSVK